MTAPTDDLPGVLRLDDDRMAARFERVYETHVEDLWGALTEANRLARWLALVSGELQVGGAFRIDFDGDVTTGTVLACDPPRRLDVSWDFAGGPASRVLVRIDDTAGGSQLVLDHSRLPTAQSAGYGAGWHAYLARLGALLAAEPMPSWDELFGASLEQYQTAKATLR